MASTLMFVGMLFLLKMMLCGNVLLLMNLIVLLVLIVMDGGYLLGNCARSLVFAFVRRFRYLFASGFFELGLVVEC